LKAAAFCSRAKQRNSSTQAGPVLNIIKSTMKPFALCSRRSSAHSVAILLAVWFSCSMFTSSCDGAHNSPNINIAPKSQPAVARRLRQLSVPESENVASMTILKVKEGQFLGDIDILPDPEQLHPGKLKKTTVFMEPEDTSLVGADKDNAKSRIQNLVQESSLGSIHRPDFLVSLEMKDGKSSSAESVVGVDINAAKSKINALVQESSLGSIHRPGFDYAAPEKPTEILAAAPSQVESASPALKDQAVEPKTSTAPKDETEQELPTGWTGVKDPTSGQTYYWNKGTGEVTWTRPTMSQEQETNTVAAVEETDTSIEDASPRIEETTVADGAEETFIEETRIPAFEEEIIMTTSAPSTYEEVLLSTSAPTTEGDAQVEEEQQSAVPEDVIINTSEPNSDVDVFVSTAAPTTTSGDEVEQITNASTPTVSTPIEEAVTPIEEADASVSVPEETVPTEATEEIIEQVTETAAPTTETASWTEDNVVQESELTSAEDPTLPEAQEETASSTEDMTVQGSSSVSEELPDGWQQVTDPQSGASYYWNQQTNEVWQAITDPGSGRVYYWNPTTNESTWSIMEKLKAETANSEPDVLVGASGPVGVTDLAEGWQAVADAETGSVYYWNDATTEVWQAVPDQASGKVYYWNPATSEASWSVPASLVKEQVLSMTYLKVKNGEFLGEMDSGKLDDSDLLHPGKAKKAAVSGPESPVVGSDVNSAMSAIKSLVQSTSVGSIHRPGFEYLPSSGESKESAETVPALVKPSVVSKEPAPIEEPESIQEQPTVTSKESSPIQEQAVTDEPVADEESAVVTSEEPLAAEEPVVVEEPVAEHLTVQEEIESIEEPNVSIEEPTQIEEPVTSPDVPTSEDLPASDEMAKEEPTPEVSEMEASNIETEVAIADPIEDEQAPEATEQSASAEPQEEAQQLPEGWTFVTDPATGASYYWNQLANEVWQVVSDPGSGMVYYWNPLTNESTWYITEKMQGYSAASTMSELAAVGKAQLYSKSALSPLPRNAHLVHVASRPNQESLNNLNSSTSPSFGLLFPIVVLALVGSLVTVFTALRRRQFKTLGGANFQKLSCNADNTCIDGDIVVNATESQNYGAV